jgi:nucleoside 2-deoxyribosyltransferase
VAEQRDLEVIVYAPDLANIRAWFEVPKRYYRRNKELLEACDLLHAFPSREDGYTGGTRFEIEYAVSLNIPVQVHRENGKSQWFNHHSFPFIERKQEFFLSWQGFFHKTDIELGALK